jgi:hypothetical protein
MPPRFCINAAKADARVAFQLEGIETVVSETTTYSSASQSAAKQLMCAGVRRMWWQDEETRHY